MSATSRSNSPKRIKKVSFPSNDNELANVVCTLINREDLSDQDHSDLWFSGSEYCLCRSTAKVTSQESQRFGYSNNLNGVFTEKTRETQQRLNLWAAHGHSRRGLERWANRELGEIRQQAQFKAIMDVLRAQDDMLAKSKTGQIDDEVLRRVSTRATKVSRHFARMMGKADAYALTFDSEKIEERITTAAANATATAIATALPAVKAEVCNSPHSVEEVLRSGLRKLHIGSISRTGSIKKETARKKGNTNARIPRIA